MCACWCGASLSLGLSPVQCMLLCCCSDDTDSDQFMLMQQPSVRPKCPQWPGNSMCTTHIYCWCMLICCTLLMPL